MASIPLRPDFAPVINHSSAMPAVAQILGRYDRPQLEAFVSVAIDLLDAMDGDLDLGPNGDELDGSGGEDDFWPHSSNWLGEPGCPLSDPDTAVDDYRCDDIDQDLEPEEPLVGDYGLDQSRGPLDLSLSQDRELKRPHIQRIRNERC